MFTMCPQRGHDAALRARGYIGGCPPGLSRPVAGLRTAGLSTAGPPCCNCAGERNLARASDISCLPPPSLGRARASTKPASQRGPCRMRLRTPFCNLSGSAGAGITSQLLTSGLIPKPPFQISTVRWGLRLCGHGY
jgi:hypothetical protein